MADFFRKLFGSGPQINNNYERPTSEEIIHTGIPTTLNYVMGLNALGPLFLYDKANEYHIPVRLVPEIKMHNTVTSIRVFIDSDIVLDQDTTCFDNLTFDKAYATYLLNGTFAIQLVNSDKKTIYLQQQHGVEIDA